MKRVIYIINEFNNAENEEDCFELPTIALTNKREAYNLLKKLQENPNKLETTFSIVELKLVDKASEAIGSRSYNGWKIQDGNAL